MTNVVRVVPAEGARIRQPNRNGRVMPQEGDFVSPDDMFYARLILSGDLVVVKGEPPKAEEAKPATFEAAPAQDQPLGKKNK